MAQRLRQFRVTVATSGTAKRLSDVSLKVSAALVVADPANTGTVYLGDENALASSRLGIPIIASDDVELDPTQYSGTTEEIELSDIWFDSTASGDTVIVSYYESEDD